MSTELALIEPKNAALVFVANGCDPIIERIRAEIKKEAPNLDISTEAGRDAIRSLAYKIAQSKTKLDNIGKTLTDDQRAAIAAVNAERSRVWAELEKIQAEVRAPLTEWENAEKTRVTTHEGAIKSIADLGLWGELTPTSAQVEERLQRLPALFQRDWQEFSGRATVTHDQVQSGLQRLLADRKKAEDEAAELLRLRAEEDERNRRWDAMYADANTDNVAFDAAAKVAAEAERQRIAREEQVERDRQANQKIINDQNAALAKAEKDKKDAEILAEQNRKGRHEDRLGVLERKVEFPEEPTAADVQARIASLKDFDGIDWQEFQERAVETKIRVTRELAKLLGETQAREEEAQKERQRVSDEAAAKRERDRQAAEKKKEDDATAAREKDKAHKKKINNEAVSGLIGIDHPALTEELARAIITAIALGKVPNVKINY